MEPTYSLNPLTFFNLILFSYIYVGNDTINIYSSNKNKKLKKNEPTYLTHLPTYPTIYNFK